jgi:hypothetical protein
MEVVGSLLTFCNSTCIVNIISRVETCRWTKQCKKYTSIKSMSCIWLCIVYIYNSIEHNGCVSPESYVCNYSLIIIHFSFCSLHWMLPECRPNFKEIASYMKGWADLAYRLRKTLNTLHTTKLKPLGHEKENDSQYKKSCWTFNNKKK